MSRSARDLGRVDLLIPIKAAVYEEEVPADAGSPGPRRTRWRSSIFAREILHRSSLSTSDRAGRKQARGYIICKRDAVHHFMSKGKNSRRPCSGWDTPHGVLSTVMMHHRGTLEAIGLERRGKPSAGLPDRVPAAPSCRPGAGTPRGRPHWKHGASPAVPFAGDRPRRQSRVGPPAGSFIFRAGPSTRRDHRAISGWRLARTGRRFKPARALHIVGQ